VAKQAGFCFGVKKALEIARNVSQSTAEKVYTLGPLIHNPQAVAKLAQQGVASIESLAEIEHGELIIRSHGVTPQILAAGAEKGLKMHDATCPFVKKAQQLAYEHAEEGYRVIVVGDPDHPEVQGILGWAGVGALVADNSEAVNLLGNYDKICVIAQTTQSPEKFHQIVDMLRSKAKEIKICNTICSATRKRQEAAKELAWQSEVMIVVGGKNSSNTNKLAQICTGTGTPTYHVEDASELEADWFKGVSQVGVTAGASTPDWLLEEVIGKMTEFNQEETKQEENAAEQLTAFERGDIITGTVVQINEKNVLVDVGGKSEGIIPLSELSLKDIESPAGEINVGEVVDLYVIKTENEEGVPILSKRRADRLKTWEKLEKAHAAGEVIEGKAEQVVKGGLLVDIGLRGFMPASLIEIGYVENMENYVGKTIRFKVVELDKEKNKIILSQKVVLEEEAEKKKANIFNNLAVGQTVTGTVRRLTNFGAFVDVGGVDGLLHISELSWGRVNNPKDVLTEGEQIDVYVLAIDKNKGKISLGLKQLLPNPWQKAGGKYRPGQVIEGKIARIVSFGVFVELETGVEGLVHISQLAREHVNRPEDVVAVGQIVKAKVLDVDVANERISLSIKDAAGEVKDKDVEAFMEKNEHTSGVTLGELFGDIFKETKK
jgi:4-hydroxy-3-methylbut-2-enyl diphosphate reductase